MTRGAWREMSMTIATLVFLASCGDGDPGPSSGLARDKHVQELSSTELAMLCDWSAAKFGGYGHRTSCSNGNWLMAAMNRMVCTTGATSSICDPTVAQTEDCVNAYSANPCGGL